MVETIRKDVRKKLTETEGILHDAGVEVEVMMPEDDIPSQGILNFVRASGASLLVMGTHAFGGMERFLLGSTAEEVLREAHCPVVTVGPQVASSTKNGPHLQNILYATDFSEASLAVVPFLAALQKSAGAQLRILHVAADHDSGIGEESKRFDPIRRLLGANGDKEYVVLHGTNVGQAIVNEAERCPADLVVLGVKHASAFVAHAAPKIAFQIVAASPCPVLTVSS
jgi:nucleotide-binding universal stress UspA family protein